MNKKIKRLSSNVTMPSVKPIDLISADPRPCKQINKEKSVKIKIKKVIVSEV